MKRLIGIAYNKAVYPLNPNRRLRHFLSISDASERKTYTETASRNLAPTYAHSTSKTNSQNVLFASARSSTGTLNILLSSITSTDDITPSKPLMQTGLLPKLQKKSG
jgi:hypothetical protein